MSGNVSLYNETDGRAILPTPTIGAVGLIEKGEHVVTAHFKRPGETIVLLGPVGDGPLGGSEYVVSHTGKVTGPLAVDRSRDGEQAAATRARAGASAGRIVDARRFRRRSRQRAGRVLRGGGSADQMIGADVTLPTEPSNAVAALFSESPSRVVTSFPTSKLADIQQRAAKAGMPITLLGKTAGQGIVLRGGGKELVRADLNELRDARERCLVSIVGE